MRVYVNGRPGLLVLAPDARKPDSWAFVHLEGDATHTRVPPHRVERLAPAEADAFRRLWGKAPTLQEELP